MIIHRPRSVDDPFYRPSAADYARAYVSILRAARGAGSSASGGLGSSASAGSAVLILVSPDVDGLAAAKALASLLRDDEIPHRVVPVDGYATLTKVVKEDVQSNWELHTLVLLNLGSLLSLPTYFTASPPNEDDEDEELDAPRSFHLPPRCTVHLVDSHRPYNLDNLFATSELMERICVWDDGEIQERLAEREGKAYEALEFQVEEGEDDDSDEDRDSEIGSDEDESDEDDAASMPSDDEDDDDAERAGDRRRKRRRIRSAGSDFGREDEDGDDVTEASDDEMSRRRRKRKSRRNRQRAERLPAALVAQHRATLSRYYARGTGHGMSVASMMFLLAEKLGRADNESLWLAIIGLSSQYLLSALPYDLYDDYSRVLASDVRSMNPNTTPDVSVDQSESVGLSVKPNQADDGAIRVIEQELRFTLYRHWSLENAMYHTAYVAGKLGIWREKGVGKLRGLMAKMGFSLSQCRQNFEHMDLDLRKTLVTRIESIAPEYGLTECVYRSFLRSFGFQAAAMSAADAVEGLSALLCAAHGVRIEVDAPGLTFAGAGVGSGAARAVMGGATSTSSELFGAKRLWNIGGGSLSKPAAPSISVQDKENRPPGAGDDQNVDKTVDDSAATGLTSSDQQQQMWVRNFFTAYHALDCRKASSIALLRSSLSLSKSLHRAIITQGVSLIDKQSIRFLKSFRLAVLQDGPDLPLFSTQPAVLTRLALWLVDALRDIVAEQDQRRVSAKRARKAAAAAAAAAAKKGKRKGFAEEQEEEEEDDPRKLLPQSMPFVLAALDEERDRFLVVGVNGATSFGDVRKNRFGLAFQDAATRSGARTRHDRFETSAIEVRREDLAEFINTLHLKA